MTGMTCATGFSCCSVFWAFAPRHCPQITASACKDACNTNIGVIMINHYAMQDTAVSPTDLLVTLDLAPFQVFLTAPRAQSTRSSVPRVRDALERTCTQQQDLEANCLQGHGRIAGGAATLASHEAPLTSDMCPYREHRRRCLHCLRQAPPSVPVRLAAELLTVQKFQQLGSKSRQLL